MTKEEVCCAIISFFVSAAGGVEILQGCESEIGEHVIVTIQDTCTYLEDECREFRGADLYGALVAALTAWVRKTGQEHNCGKAILEHKRTW